MNPNVSLCMATCLRADLFPQSFRALLEQNYSPLEIIVLADGANAASLEILRSCKDQRVRWISTEQPSGMIPAWNRVVAEAKGKYFLFCADDDILLPGAVEEQVRLMEANPNVGFCHGDFDFIDDDGREIGSWRSHEGTWIKPGLREFPRYLVSTLCCMQTTLVRTEAYLAVGGWDNDAGNPGDNSLYLKLLRAWDVGHVSRTICKYRIRTRTPDNWQKRMKNSEEFLRLSLRHLGTLPQPLQSQKKTIERKLAWRSFRDAAYLYSSASNNLEREHCTNWFLNEVPGTTLFQRTFLQLSRIGAMRAWVLFQGIWNTCKSLVKKTLRR